MIGEDILPFHAVTLVGILRALELPAPAHVHAHDLLRVGGRKMSKSLGNVVDPQRIVQAYGADAAGYGPVSKVSVACRATTKWNGGKRLALVSPITCFTETNETQTSDRIQQT